MAYGIVFSFYFKHSTKSLRVGTPYLLSLGLTKSYMSLVWIAGPLSGKVL